MTDTKLEDCSHTVARKLYQRMQELNDNGMRADGWKETSPGYWERDECSVLELGNGISIHC